MTMMTVVAPENEQFDPDDVLLRDSPPLKPLKPKLSPTPSPPPDLPDPEDSPPPQSPSSRKPPKRVKSVPSQGDAVLLNFLGGGKALDVARTAATELLASDDEMSEGGSQKGADLKMPMDVDTEESKTDLTALAIGALKFTAHAATTPTESVHPKVEEVVASPPTMNGNDGHGQIQPLAPMAIDSTSQGMRHLSPNTSGPKSGDELAPIQQPSPKSEKANNLTLPSISSTLGDLDLMQLAEASTAAATANKDTPGEHRLSISHSHSPPGPPLFSNVPGQRPGGHGSPPISPNDNFRRELPSPGRGSVAGASPYYPYTHPRRPSQASEAPQYMGGTPGDYSSTETPSTDQSTPGIPTGIDRMSIDNINNPQIGGFQCRYPGCNAQPFQTQYLLNSHANVHSSNRPHYCPVKGCTRGEGGKGFKRKNEMIRHGLVHESPGYVCPYCEDREHKYPRPDNLQRHVRVHHVDKDKDDPLLRDVLAQRPEGPSRGRRRRGGNT